MISGLLHHPQAVIIAFYRTQEAKKKTQERKIMSITKRGTR